MKRILFLSTQFLSALILATLMACGGSPTDEASRYRYNPDIGLILKNGGEIARFEILRDSILSPRCASCHSWVSSEKEILSRIVPGKPEQSTLFQYVDSGKMPQNAPRLPESEISYLRSYIEEKGREPMRPNPTPEATPIPLASTYPSLRVHFFERSCLRCHNAEKSKGGYDFSTYEKVKMTLEDIQREAIDSDNMPIGGAPMPTDEIKAAFREWVKNGAPEK